MITKTKFKDLVLIQNKAYKDKRGFFKEILRENELNSKFPFVVMSKSKKNIFLFLKEKFLTLLWI